MARLRTEKFSEDDMSTRYGKLGSEPLHAEGAFGGEGKRPEDHASGALGSYLGGRAL